MDAFESLEIWKRSSRLCIDVYKKLDSCRSYGFKDQALSVPNFILASKQV